MNDNTQAIYPQDADPWYVQRKLSRGDWETIATVPRARHTRSEALRRYEHMNGKLRVVSKSQAIHDYQAGRASRPDGQQQHVLSGSGGCILDADHNGPCEVIAG